MKKYKVLTPLFKLSNKQNYIIGDDIELSEDEAEILIKEGRIQANNKEPYSESEEGTKGIVTRKTPEQADKEIKAANKKLNKK